MCWSVIDGKLISVVKKLLGDLVIYGWITPEI